MSKKPKNNCRSALANGLLSFIYTALAKNNEIFG